jgi:catalase-peroxidase
MTKAMHHDEGSTGGKCPFVHGAATTPDKGTNNPNWRPNQLDISTLHQHDTKSNLMDHGFDYKIAFNSIDYGKFSDD